MTVHYGVYGATGLRYIWCQTAVSNCIGLTSKPLLFVLFDKHTTTAFLFKCIEEPTFGSLPTPTPPPSCLITPYELNYIGEAWKNV